MKTVKSICLLLALSVSASAFAAHWDSVGSKPSNNRGSSYKHRSTADHDSRYNDNRHNDNRYNNNRHDNRSRSSSHSSINIIVGARPPISRWNPVYNSAYYNNYNNGYYNSYYGYNRSYNSSTFLFDSSLGYLPRTVVNTINRPVVIHNDYYVQERPTTVIRYSEPVSSTILFKDRYGQCFEKEIDSNGREIRTQVADATCDF